MIAGIILLTIFLSALVFTLLIAQQYDVYQSTAAGMQQMQIDMYSENLLAVYPGVVNGTGTQVGNVFQVSCVGGGGLCNNYTVIVNNLGITTQVVRLYIDQPGSRCAPCIIDPANATYPVAADHFRVASNQVSETVNSGESQHYIVFWLPSGTSLSTCVLSTQCKISIATSRGRIFSFLLPFSPSAFSSGSSGGTGIYIGPLVITFQKELITYTNNNITNPPIPIGGNNGYWTLTPGAQGKIILYVKIQTDVNVTSDVYLTPQSVFELERFDNPGVVNFFFAIAPITPTFCAKFKLNPPYNQDLNCNGVPYLADPSGNTGNIASIVPYNACGQPPRTYNTSCTGRYIIPKPDPVTQRNQKGTPIIVAFAVSVVSGGTNKLQTIQNSWNGKSVTSYLGLSYVYQGYLYGVTLPFIAMCIDSCGI